MHLFFIPLKISENRKVFWCFQEVEKRSIGNKRVKIRKYSILCLLKYYHKSIDFTFKTSKTERFAKITVNSS